MGVPRGYFHAESVGDAGHGLPDAAESDDAELLAEQFETVGTVPIALLDLHIKRSGVPGQFHEQRHGVLGDGVIAVMQHVANADAAFLGFLKIDVAGDAGASERIALGVEPVEDGIGAVESDDHDGVGILAAFHDGVLVQCEILVHAHAGHVFEHREVLFERSDHRFDDHRHDHQRQVGAVRLGLENSIHIFTSHHERKRSIQVD